MSERFVVHRQHGGALLALLGLLMLITISFLFISIGEVAFRRIGFTPFQYSLILVGTLLGSAVNIPIMRVTSKEPLTIVEEARVFWRTYRIPRTVYRERSTIVAVNLGGAIIPVVVSVYIIVSHPEIWSSASLGTMVMALLVRLMARKVKGVGIVTPSLLPPIAAAITAYLLMPTSPAFVAYVCGTLGTLIGADLLNLGDISKLGAPVASIGGAGTFDGVFLTGIIAVILAPAL